MSTVFELHDLVIDAGNRSVHRAGQPLKLPDLSFELLIELLRAAPEPVTFKDLSERVWNVPHVSNDTIAQRVALVRKALDDDPKDPAYIRTVRGCGYAIMGGVHKAEEPSPPKRPARHSSFARRTAILAASVALAVVSLHVVRGDLAGLWPQEDASGSIEVAPSANGLLIDRAKTQLRLHQPLETDRAIFMLRRALIEDPGSFDARLTLSFALSTSATKFGGDVAEEKEAERLARTLISERPDSSDAWSALGYVLSAQARADEALAAFRQAFELRPDNTAALSSAAHILLLQGDLQQALVLEARARKHGGSSRYSEIQIAQILQLIGDDTASWWWDTALQLNPGQAVIIGELASMHVRNEDPRAALDTIAQYAGPLASAPQLLALQGRSFAMLGRVEEAREALGAAGWRGHYLLAAMDAANGDPSTAKELFPSSKRLEIDGLADPESLVQLAEVDAALGDVNASLQRVSQAVSLGWRDIAWLESSPYLSAIMATPPGIRIADRIERELSAQRVLIANTKELDELLRQPGLVEERDF